MTGKKFNHITYIEKNCIRKIEDFYTVSVKRWDSVLRAYKYGDFFTALYIGGYCVECMLKYVILKDQFDGKTNLNLKQEREADHSKRKACNLISSHNIASMMTFGNEENIFKTPKEAEHKIVGEWKVDWRYATKCDISKEQAKLFLESIILMSEQLEGELNGKIKLRAFNPLP